MKSNDHKTRYDFLDAFRGLLVISMILYHFIWDLVFLKGVDWPWFRYYSMPVRLWQVFMRFSFIFLSGYCLNLSGRPVRRGLELTFCGALITAVTLIALPESAIIFGVLTFLGAATLIGAPVKKYYKGNAYLSALCLLTSLTLYIMLRGLEAGYIGIMFHPLKVLAREFYRGCFMTFLGFLDPSFRSTDYVPLLPWIFVYFMGFFTGKLSLPLLEKVYRPKGSSNLFILAGRHALLLYMIHQPLLAGITYLLIYLPSF